jgi:hypothetical protein
MRYFSTALPVPSRASSHKPVAVAQSAAFNIRVARQACWRYDSPYSLGLQQPVGGRWASKEPARGAYDGGGTRFSVLCSQSSKLDSTVCLLLLALGWLNQISQGEGLGIAPELVDDKA